MPRESDTEMMALEGIKVLDLARVAPGSHCGMMLGDLGADVLKIEMPYTPDSPPLGSGVSAHPDSADAERRAAYHPLNRNKKSLALNLREEKGKEVFHKIVGDADVLLEGFRPGVTKRLGIDYDTLAAINSRLIYCSISGYGQDGPYQQMPGHDINYISFGGALGMIGNGDSPVIPLNLVADYAGGSLHATVGILTAIVAREKTGKGQYVDVSMTDGVVSLLAPVAFNYFYDDMIPRRGQDVLNGGASYYNVYRTKDGKFISLGCMETHFWENLCKALGREDFIQCQYSEGDKKEEILTCFQDIFCTKTRDEWFNELGEKNIPIAKVYSIDEVFSDPQVLHRKMVVNVPHSGLGEVPQVGIALKLSDTPGRVRSTAPLLGEHSVEVLRAVGYNSTQIEEMRMRGVIQ